MRSSHLVSLALFAAVAAQAQPPDTLWSRTYGGGDADRASTVHGTSDGGYILGGHTKSFGAGQYDCWLTRTNAGGVQMWSRTYGGSQYDYCYGAEQTSDGGFVCGGYTGSFGAGGDDFWLIRTESSGDTLWTRTFGGLATDQCYAMQRTADDGCILAGRTNSFGAGFTDLWVLKASTDGDSMWSRTYGGPQDEICQSVEQTEDGGYVLAGGTNSSGAGDFDAWLVRTNPQGDSVWSRTYGGSLFDKFVSVQQTSDGYIAAGYTRSFGAGGSDGWLLKTDSEGDSLWSRTLGGTGAEYFCSVLQTPDGGYVVGGYTASFGADSSDYWLVKYDANGDTLWTMLIGGPRNDYGLCLARASDAGYMFGGYTESFGSGGADYWLVKTEPELSADEPLILHPSSFSLSACPNPFNPTTTIGFDVPVPSNVRVTVFDLLGRNVATIVNERLMPGAYQRAWDASDLPSGMYWCRLDAGSITHTRKMLLLQ